MVHNARRDKTAEKLLDKIDSLLGQPELSHWESRIVLRLAESFAWVENPSQPHGGSLEMES